MQYNWKSAIENHLENKGPHHESSLFHLVIDVRGLSYTIKPEEEEFQIMQLLLFV